MMLRSSLFVSLLLFLLPTAASATEPLYQDVPTAPGSPTTREAFYCQAPDYALIYQMSSGFDAEFADDLPEDWIGTQVEAVTLWLGEWYSVGGPTWTDPLGIRLNFYHESCPPELDAFRSIEVAWADLTKVHVHSSGGSDVYEIVVLVDPPMEIGDAMSIGATALIDWGHDEPFTGLCATPFHVSYGACPAYLDGSWWGYYRWTAIDHYTGIPQDLGYCMTSSTTAASSPPAALNSLNAYPNPFNPSTTISYSFAESGQVSLRILDLSGRELIVLVDRSQGAGEHRETWDGRDGSGSELPAGLYLVEMRRGDIREFRKLVLLK